MKTSRASVSVQTNSYAENTDILNCSSLSPGYYNDENSHLISSRKQLQQQTLIEATRSDYYFFFFFFEVKALQLLVTLVKWGV